MKTFLMLLKATAYSIAVQILFCFTCKLFFYTWNIEPGEVLVWIIIFVNILGAVIGTIAFYELDLPESKQKQ